MTSWGTSGRRENGHGGIIFLYGEKKNERFERVALDSNIIVNAVHPKQKCDRRVSTTQTIKYCSTVRNFKRLLVRYNSWSNRRDFRYLFSSLPRESLFFVFLLSFNYY